MQLVYLESFPRWKVIVRNTPFHSELWFKCGGKNQWERVYCFLSFKIGVEPDELSYLELAFSEFSLNDEIFKISDDYCSGHRRLMYNHPEYGWEHLDMRYVNSSTLRTELEDVIIESDIKRYEQVEIPIYQKYQIK